MIDLIDMLTATAQERDWAQRWADFAIRRFKEHSVEVLRGGLNADVRVKSKRALRMAIRRAEANLQSRIAVSTEPHG